MLTVNDMLTVNTHVRNTRSSKGGPQLIEPKTRFGGDRPFNACAPRLWNNLPESLRTCSCIYQFRRQLKTNLFKQFIC